VFITQRIVMETHNFFKLLGAYFPVLFVAGVIFVLNGKASGQETNLTYKTTPADVIASVNLEWFSFSLSDRAVRNFAEDRQKLIRELLNTFNNPNASNFNRCTCALYLGEMRAADAASALAPAISLELDPHVDIKGVMLAQYDPALNALVKIGSPAIPALIRNLAESGDAKVRTLSLKALHQIDNDNDIVRLRLGKALKAESDPQNQSRLRVALKAINDNPFEK
jgi:hypothetical protein